MHWGTLQSNKGTFQEKDMVLPLLLFFGKTKHNTSKVNPNRCSMQQHAEYTEAQYIATRCQCNKTDHKAVTLCLERDTWICPTPNLTPLNPFSTPLMSSHGIRSPPFETPPHCLPFVSLPLSYPGTLAPRLPDAGLLSCSLCEHVLRTLQ